MSEPKSPGGVTHLAVILGIAVSVTALIGFGFVVYDRTRPVGPPKFKAAITDSATASDLGDFLRRHDGETVELILDCDTTDASHCIEPPYEEARDTLRAIKYQPLYLFEQERCQKSPNEDCPGGWWLFFKTDKSDPGAIYNRAGAGTLRITGYWRVRVGGLSAMVGPNCFRLDAVTGLPT